MSMYNRCNTIIWKINVTVILFYLTKKNFPKKYKILCFLYNTFQNDNNKFKVEFYMLIDTVKHNYGN